MSTGVKPRTSSIPTPGRLRSYSSSVPAHDPLPPDLEATRAFHDAMKSNDPSRYSGRSVSAHNPPTQRPPSAASGANSRPKTPSAQFRRISHPQTRPESQQSDRTSHKQKDFVVGDSVRIESLGFEGKLRYVGEIAGKQGTWAGVELSGGFAGLGKNNGSVGTKSYFSCPDKCGVFIAYGKLSAPTVAKGSHSRSSSVASSRASLPGPGRISSSSLYNGRVTPVDSGRVTPARSNGRVTPSSSLEFSSSMATSRTLPRPSFGLPPASNTPSATAMSRITAGSRASKYVGITAQQLSARSQRPGPPGSPTKTGIGLGSPARLRGPPSPSRPDSRSSSGGTGTNTPGGTPKPNTRLSFGTPRVFGTGRPSLTATPRARIPSAVAMPPPPSPSSIGSGQRSISLNDKPATPTFSTTSNETAVDDDGMESLASIQNNSKALQDKIQSLLSGKPSRTESPKRRSSTTALQEDPLFSPKTVASRQLTQDRVDRLERENARLKAELDEARLNASKPGETETLTTERDKALDRVKELESSLKTSERTVDERNTKIESLERSVQASNSVLQTLRAEEEARVKDLEAKLEDSQTLIASLKEAIEAKANEAGQNEGLLQAKDAEIALLEGRVKKAATDLEETRKDLSAQIEELRHAGQETIALYEERLAAADGRRYQLEDVIDKLEEQINRRGSLSRSVSSTHDSAEATRIDNEALREQVQHLQSKISTLEDMLEDARNSLEREEAIARNRIQRHKENEAALRNEITETRRAMETLAKSESLARAKAEEAEEALRENTMTLENAQAEIEGLRTEIASLENVQARTSSERSRDDESSRVLAIERERHTEEVSQLKDLLEAARNARKEAVQDLDSAKQDALSTSSSVSSLKQAVESLDAEKAELEHVRSDLISKLERERTAVAELRRALDEKASELEAARKTLNRDRPINAGLGLQDMPTPTASSTPTKQDLSNYKEEIKGLQHIVQELQKEISAISARNKMLESENNMLTKETDTLRQELKVLEENVEQNLINEEHALDSASGERASGEPKISQAEVERLRKQLAEVEKKNARTIHELNKEVSELESLVEAKIYREDELEREIERLRQKTSKRPSKSSTETLGNSEPRYHHSATSSTGTISLHVNGSSAKSSTEKDGGSAEEEHDSEVCEICEAPGHDIFSCPLLKDGSAESAAHSTSQRGGSAPVETELYCEDCDGRGHVAADCPYSSDVF
ncbi:hypothetical protein ACEPAG_7663 [Sanghuangporus baumii]